MGASVSAVCSDNRYAAYEDPEPFDIHQEVNDMVEAEVSFKTTDRRILVSSMPSGTTSARDDVSVSSEGAREAIQKGPTSPTSTVGSMLRRCDSSPASLEIARESAAPIPRQISDPTAGWLLQPDGPQIIGLSTREQPIQMCCVCQRGGVDLFVDPSDRERYCAFCWSERYGEAPETRPLVRIEAIELLSKQHLADLWDRWELPSWPTLKSEQDLGKRRLAPHASLTKDGGWSNISVCVRPGLVGDDARQRIQSDRGLVGETLAGRYKVTDKLGQGNFTKAFLAKDTKKGEMVCLKCYHRRCTMEELVDLMVLSQRLNDVDPQMACFPHVLDAFFDIAGFTVETLIFGQHCFGIAAENPHFFADLKNLAHVARGAVSGLMLLEQVGIVHNDLKPDNILWVESPSIGDGSPKRRGTRGTPSVRIVDFGCARLDQREDPNNNWNLAEGGAGHLAYASPEMNLGFPVTHESDVWSLGVLLCELHCGRGTWHSETLCAEEVMAQALGLSGMDSVPSSLLRRSPIDIRRLYTPAFAFGPGHLPVLRRSDGTVEVLTPLELGLEQVIGETWKEEGKGELQELLAAALQLDFLKRPSATELWKRFSFVSAAAVPPARLRKWSSPFACGRTFFSGDQPRNIDPVPLKQTGAQVPPARRAGGGTDDDMPASPRAKAPPRSNGAVERAMRFRKADSSASFDDSGPKMFG